MLRRNTPLKPGTKGLKRTAMKKVSAKRPGVLKADREMYQRIWDSRPRVCEECGIQLGSEPRPHFFSHILTKAAHPKLRHVDQNIQLLCLEHHNQWEFGKRKEMRTWELNECRISLLLEYEQSI